MSMSWEYSGSRIKGKIQCNLCEKGSFYGSDTWLDLTDSTGKTIRYLKQTCQYCGNTKLFDIAQAKSVKYDNFGVEEIFSTE